MCNRNHSQLFAHLNETLPKWCGFQILCDLLIMMSYPPDEDTLPTKILIHEVMEEFGASSVTPTSLLNDCYSLARHKPQHKEGHDTRTQD